MIDAVTLRRLWPHAPQALIDAIATRAGYVFNKYGITTPLRAAHFMAQVSHESDGGLITCEDMSYSSAQRIAAVWPTRFTPASAAPYVHNPRGLADKVYNGRMGNAPGSDDGFNYRGHGLLQITGRESYREIGALTGLPLEQRPELAYAASCALEVAAAEFKKLGCLPYCDQDNINAVTHRVNGGYIGLASRKVWLAHWKAELGHEDAVAPETEPHEIPPVEIPRGSDDHLPPPAVPVSQDRSSWAGVIAAITAVGTYLGQAVDAVRPLLSDPRTLGAAAAIAVIAGLVILYESRQRARAANV